MAIRPETEAALRKVMEEGLGTSTINWLMPRITPVLEKAAEELKDRLADDIFKIMLSMLDEMITNRRSSARAYGIPPRVVEIEVSAWETVRQVLLESDKIMKEDEYDKPATTKES